MALKRPIEMVRELQAWGLSLCRIGRECHLSEPSLHRLSKGLVKRPRIETELKIRNLYDKYIGKGV